MAEHTIQDTPKAQRDCASVAGWCMWRWEVGWCGGCCPSLHNQNTPRSMGVEHVAAHRKAGLTFAHVASTSTDASTRCTLVSVV